MEPECIIAVFPFRSQPIYAIEYVDLAGWRQRLDAPRLAKQGDWRRSASNESRRHGDVLDEVVGEIHGAANR